MAEMAGQAGEGGGDGGEAGAAGVGPSSAQPGIYGAVRILVDSEPVCGGTLQTNSWVLTADRCVPAGTPIESLQIGFGMSSDDFEQLRSVLEIRRFPGNDGSEFLRGRDLLLLGVDTPFRIDGATNRHFMTLWDMAPSPRAHRCVGWDLRAAPSATNALHSEVLMTFAYEMLGPTYGQRLWWLNSNVSEPAKGALPMPADLGTACFLERGNQMFQVTVHGDNPEYRFQNAGANNDVEAYSTGLAEPEVHEWVERALFGELVPEFISDGVPLRLAGDAALCSLGADSLDLFAATTEGHIDWYQLEKSEWVLKPEIGPLDSGSFSLARPAALCLPDGSRELFALDADGRVWWRRWLAGSAAWNADWDLVYSDDFGAFESGLTAVATGPESFHIWGRGWNEQLIHAEYGANGAPQWVWKDLGGPIVGAPVACTSYPGRIDVFAQAPGDRLYQQIFELGAWGGWLDVGETLSEPAMAGCRDLRFDFFLVMAESWLMRYSFDNGWSQFLRHTGLIVPEGQILAISRERANIDVFVSGPSGLEHAIWPRPPQAQVP